MAIADLQTDWSLLSKLLRLAQGDGWTIVFGKDRVTVSNRRTEQGVVVLPATLIAHARGAGWQVVRRPMRFELRHPEVRQSVEVCLSAA
jgi:hypothetical protein